jgi:hypothetical protein
MTTAPTDPITVLVPTTPSFGKPVYGDPQNLSVIVNGVTYALDDGTFCYWVGDDGLGMAPLHRLSERGPLQDGDTDRGYRLDPRSVRLVLDIVKNSQEDFENARRSLARIFKPTNTAMILKFEMETGTFCLDCFYVGSMSMPSNERLGWNQTVVVDLKASDPTYYDPTGAAHTFAISAGSDTMLVPTTIPMTVGASSIEATETLVNDGSVSTFPFIRITGPIASPVITNNSTGEKLDFTGHTIAAGRSIDIDLRYGYKTVVADNGTNEIDELTSDSDLVSFHLGADPEVGDGNNSITVTGTSCTDDTALSFSWFNRYIGI